MRCKNKFEAPDVASVSPVVNANGVTLTSNDTTYHAVFVRRHDPELPAGPQLHDGRGFLVHQRAGARSTAASLVVGPTVVSELFGGQDPVGDTVQVNGTNFEIIGVTASKGSNGTSNQDDVGIAPLSAVQDTLTGYASINQIVVQAKSRHRS